MPLSGEEPQSIAELSAMTLGVFQNLCHHNQQWSNHVYHQGVRILVGMAGVPALPDCNSKNFFWAVNCSSENPCRAVEREGSGQSGTGSWSPPVTKGVTWDTSISWWLCFLPHETGTNNRLCGNSTKTAKSRGGDPARGRWPGHRNRPSSFSPGPARWAWGFPPSACPGALGAGRRGMSHPAPPPAG